LIFCNQGEHQVNHFQYCFKTLSAFLSWLCLLFSCACSSEFFVDKGQRDLIKGVEFEITAPYLFEKKAFKLRGENLSTWQLQQIADAISGKFNTSTKLLFWQSKHFKTGKSRNGKFNSPQIIFTWARKATMCTSETTMCFEKFNSNGCLNDTPKHSRKVCCAVKKPFKLGANASLSVMPCSARLSL